MGHRPSAAAVEHHDAMVVAARRKGQGTQGRHLEAVCGQELSVANDLGGIHAGLFGQLHLPRSSLPAVRRRSGQVAKQARGLPAQAFGPLLDRLGGIVGFERAVVETCQTQFDALQVAGRELQGQRVGRIVERAPPCQAGRGIQHILHFPTQAAGAFVLAEQGQALLRLGEQQAVVGLGKGRFGLIAIAEFHHRLVHTVAVFAMGEARLTVGQLAVQCMVGQRTFDASGSGPKLQAVEREQQHGLGTAQAIVDGYLPSIQRANLLLAEHTALPTGFGQHVEQVVAEIAAVSSFLK